MKLTKTEREELENVVANYPVFPGDTIAHKSADSLGRKGLAVRDADGNWLPTGRGLLVHERGAQTRTRRPWVVTLLLAVVLLLVAYLALASGYLLGALTSRLQREIAEQPPQYPHLEPR